MDDLSYDDDEEEVDENNNNIPTHSTTVEYTNNHENTGVGGTPVIADTDTSTGLEEQDDNRLGDITGMVGDQEASSQSSESTGVEQGVDADVAIEVDQDEELHDSENNNTEEVDYEKAEQLGIEVAHDDDWTLPKRICKKKADEIYEYYNTIFTAIDVDHVLTSYDDEQSKQVFNFLTDQMSAKAGLKEFGDKGAASIMQELEQLLYRKVIVGRKGSSLTS